MCLINSSMLNCRNVICNMPIVQNCHELIASQSTHVTSAHNLVLVTIAASPKKGLISKVWVLPAPVHLSYHVRSVLTQFPLILQYKYLSIQMYVFYGSKLIRTSRE